MSSRRGAPYDVCEIQGLRKTIYALCVILSILVALVVLVALIFLTDLTVSYGWTVFNRDLTRNTMIHSRQLLRMY
ncbi:hypothetical protein N7488_005094 [Penicillium malachiteum]|nr:hypothetical protein N7488_005094 [Penicillium malachiteum]